VGKAENAGAGEGCGIRGAFRKTARLVWVWGFLLHAQGAGVGKEMLFLNSFLRSDQIIPSTYEVLIAFKAESGSVVYSRARKTRVLNLSCGDLSNGRRWFFRLQWSSPTVAESVRKSGSSPPTRSTSL